MSRTFSLIIFLWVLSPLLTAQQLGGLYNLDFNFGSVKQAPKNHVSLSCRFNEKYLVVHADITPNWHLYSITQPEGGALRTTFEFDSPEWTPLEIRPTTAPHVDSDNIFDVDIEEHENSVTWIFTFQEKLPAGKKIKGQLNGQVCLSGEGGMCILVEVPFEANFDSSLDVALLLQQAESIDDRFVLNSPPLEGGGSGLEDNETKKYDVQETVRVRNFWYALGFAFLGGVVLNFMPCVLPVIGLKILSFFEQAGKSRSRALMLNICYSLGLLTVFLVLAFMSLG
ncbi:MAG: hypothetical protein LBI05_06885, partial [Planctomycetaceae bacterium]|nr:hypothetical protein [Planctomycetaceae bacterium]